MLCSLSHLCIRWLRVSRLALFTAALLMAAFASRSAAQQQPLGSVALRWDDCYADGGARVKNFACNVNTGEERLIVSLRPSSTIPQFNGYTATVDVFGMDNVALPSWWQLQSGACRASNFFDSQTPPTTMTNCIDPWQGMGAGGANASSLGPSFIRLKITAGLTTPVELVAGTEYYMGTMRILHGKTIGTGSCGGCLQPVCLGLEDLFITQPIGLGDFHYILPMPDTDSDFVSWQGDLAMPSRVFLYHGLAYLKEFEGCLAFTPAKKPTWGGIKTLYR